MNPDVQKRNFGFAQSLWSTLRLHLQFLYKFRIPWNLAIGSAHRIASEGIRTRMTRFDAIIENVGSDYI